MKKLCVVLIACLFGIHSVSVGQETPSAQNSITLSNTYSGILNGVIISPSYSWEKPNKTISIGPTFLWSIGDQLQDRAKFKFTGIQATYQGFPIRTEGKINLYFQGDLIIQRIKDEATSQVFNLSTNSFDPFDFKKVDNNIQVYLGYGLDWSIGNNLSIIQSIGLGSVLTMRKTESGFENFTDKFLDTDWMIKFGIRRKI